MEVLGKLEVKGLLVNNQFSRTREEFEYTSGTPLKTTSRHDAWQLPNAQNFNGEEFEVVIPPFSLDIPDRNKTFN